MTSTQIIRTGRPSTLRLELQAAKVMRDRAHARAGIYYDGDDQDGNPIYRCADAAAVKECARLNTLIAQLDRRLREVSA